MAKKKNRPQEHQSSRFIETAKAMDADESGKTFEKAFKKIVPAKGKSAKTTHK